MWAALWFRVYSCVCVFFFSSRRRHTRCLSDWSSDVCSSDLDKLDAAAIPPIEKFDWHPKETVAILGEHRGRQGGAGTAVAWSKHGKWLASTSTDRKSVV